MVHARDNKIDAPFEKVVERLLASKPKPKTVKKKATPKRKTRKK